MTRFDDAVAPIAVAERSGWDESVHHGAAVALGADGAETAMVGDPHLMVYARSSLKPLQATAMVRLGLRLPDGLLALACASHDGSAAHVAGVRRVLAAHGLDETDLQNTPTLPLGEAARDAAVVRGDPPAAITQNCSGKHAAMLATCRVNDWPTERYLDPAHPLQQAVTATIAELTGSVEHVGVDGCGAPAHVVALDGLARAFATIAREEWPVARAMRAAPEMVAGPQRDVTIWMRAVRGLVAKEGAAGVMALALPDGRAAAFKIADGSDLARRAVTVEALRRIGVDVDGALAEVRDDRAVPVLGHGVPVGELRALNWDPCSS